MINYLLKLLVVVLFSSLIAFLYYTVNPSHVENFDEYIYYIVPLIIFYATYKIIKNNKKGDYTYFSLLEVVGYFLLNLLILSLIFFHISGGEDFNYIIGINLFFKILLYSIVPILIIFIGTSFGRKLLKYLNIFGENKEDRIFNFILSLGLGFFSFIFLLTIIGFLGIYNLYSVFGILLFFIIIARTEIIELCLGFLDYRIKFENHDFQSNSLMKSVALKLLSTEFLFILASIVLSINLINIVRPMPIGWDDLGVYMNFPRQMAQSGMIDFLGGMYSWQVFTGIGYMISEPVQAFFLNSVGGFLSFIVIMLIVSDLLSNVKEKAKTLINIPLLLAVIFISMPMVVFQQAKDMKLDEGLFFVSIIVFYIIVKIFQKIPHSIPLLDGSLGESSKNSNNILKLLFVAGLLAGFAFSLKFTSLLLISGIIGMIFFAKTGIAGFLGYLGLYFALFTKAGLWSYLNVSYPKENLELINTFSGISALIGFIFLSIGFLKYKKEITNLFKYLLIFVLGILVALLPWIGKNINQSINSNTSINIGTILNGKSESLDIKLENLYSEKKLKEIENKNNVERTSNSGTTSNEDLGRYLGYEKGINNYIKLPWNLTMQVNQGGEFTTIGWLFLALLPVLFLFLQFRRKGLEYFVLPLLLFEILLFVVPSSKEFLTNLMTNINLPGGYLVILGFFLIPLIYFIFLLKDNKLNNLFKFNFIFSTFYIFLFVISAFGIVWYGITMYFSLLLMIGITIYSLSSYKNDDLEEVKKTKFFGSLVICSIFLLYFFLSVFPHSFNNLKSAGYVHFKAGTFKVEEAIFVYHPKYKIILSTLNLDVNKEDEMIKSLFNLKKENEKIIYNLVIENKLDFNSIILFLNEIDTGDFDKQFLTAFKGNVKKLKNIKTDSLKIKSKFFKLILNPGKSFRNENSVYRIGTFLKYYIADNNKRLLEDSLVEFFPKYLYDKNSSSKTVENMKKLGLKYILVDLNAATIDNDPRRYLTKRYEKLLKTFTDKNLKLVESDSLCLKLSLDKYSKSEKTDKDIHEYLTLAGVNYNSYIENNTRVVSKGNKMGYCHSEIHKLLTENSVNQNNYSYLLDIHNEYKSLVANNQVKTEKDITKYLNIRVKHGSKVLFEIK